MIFQKNRLNSVQQILCALYYVESSVCDVTRKYCYLVFNFPADLYSSGAPIHQYKNAMKMTWFLKEPVYPVHLPHVDVIKRNLIMAAQ